MRLLAPLTVLALLGCASSAGDSSLSSNGSSLCLAIASRYAEALPDARVCEPSVRDSCGAQRPTVVYLKVGDQLTLEGLCQCPAYVNPARSARVDELLAQFTSKGCEIGHCPCPAPRSDGPPPCQVSETGAGACP